MKEEQAYPSRQRENLLDNLGEYLNEASETGESYFSAFRSVSLGLLGYDGDPSVTICDAAGDRGVDAYRIAGSEIEVFQFKSQNFTAKALDPDLSGDPGILSDLPRILGLLTAEEFSEEVSNKAVKKFIYEVQTALQTAAEGDDFKLSIKLLAMYKGLTAQADSELNVVRRTNEVVKVFGKEVLVEIEYIDLESLLGYLWRETNTKWIDVTGKESEWVTLKLLSKSEHAYITGRGMMVGFARARDLIDIYRRFGYQIFESNVRCEISKSPVNDAIRGQVSTKKGIDDFSLLNNGITIIAENRKQPSQGKVEIRHPQIVNGLQTITSLSEAYPALKTDIQEYFDEHCYVLVRIYEQHTIDDVPKLVKATNNQNKMEARNLVSNDPDQIAFERAFAKLGWFYERKDFAWLAFDRSEAQWSSLRGFKSRDFKVLKKAGRPLVRKVDNQEVGQHWLAFVGYVEDAAQKRRLIFDDQEYYKRIFRSRVTKHAYDYGFEFGNAAALEDIIPSAPSADALLLSTLIYRIAKENVTTSVKLKAKMVQDRKYSALSPEEVDKRLTSDPDYVTGLALSAGPFLFIEMCGLIFLRAFGPDLYGGAARSLLESTDMVDVYKTIDFEPMRVKIRGKSCGKRDLFAALWLLFRNVVHSELADNEQWKNSFLTESSKPRIMYRAATRRRILERVIDLDRLAEQRALNYDFSENMDNVGIFKYVRSIVNAGLAKSSLA